MKHISLDKHDDAVKDFVLSLPPEPEGLILELGGCPLVRVTPAEKSFDPAQLEAAILARRDASRLLNDEWLDVDREVWEQRPAGEV